MSRATAVLQTTILGLVLALSSAAAFAQDAEWVPVTGAETLRDFMSGLKAERTVSRGTLNRAEYRADGTGTLHAWGAAIPRTWSVEAEDRICVTEERVTRCYEIERNSADPTLYRALDLISGKRSEFRVTDEHAVATGPPNEVGGEGGAAAPSAAEMAAELSNPNTAVATMTFKNQFRWFEGSLPGASEEWSYTLLFQPALPFVLDSGDKILWRPAVPILFGQPTFDAEAGGFEGKAGLGDIAFDLAFAPKLETKSLLFAVGMITSLPTATDDALGTKRWTLGPELLIGKMSPWGLIGIFPNHQWGVAGSGKRDVNLTTLQALFTYLPGGGWSAGSAPIITYDWENEQWTVPLQVNVGKTVVLGGRPWKLGAEVNYYLEKPEAFGPRWMVSFSIAPVVKNGLAGWFGLGKD